ncbi:MAG: glycosyltransferase [bacterium]
MLTFFSIIIPTLNEEFFLPVLLKNLAKQKSKNFEVIIVDAKSKDKTLNIARKFKKKLKLKIVLSKKRNVSYQKNQGANHASGKYLIFLDADCKVSDIFTMKFERVISKKKGLIFYPYIKPEENSVQMKTIYQFLNFLIDISQISKNPFTSVGCMCLEKNLFNIIGGFDEKINFQEDLEIGRKAREWGIVGVHLSSVKFTFSFRKVRKEGKLKSLYIFIIGNIHYIFNKKTKKNIFPYDMGGHLYNEAKLKMNKAKLTKFDFKNLKKYLKTTFLDIED